MRNQQALAVLRAPPPAPLQSARPRSRPDATFQPKPGPIPWRPSDVSVAARRLRRRTPAAASSSPRARLPPVPRARLAALPTARARGPSRPSSRPRRDRSAPPLRRCPHDLPAHEHGCPTLGSVGFGKEALVESYGASSGARFRQREARPFQASRRDFRTGHHPPSPRCCETRPPPYTIDRCTTLRSTRGATPAPPPKVRLLLP